MRNKIFFLSLITVLVMMSCGNENTASPQAATTANQKTATTTKVASNNSIAKNVVGIKAQNVTAKSGTEVCLNVKVYNFDEILSMQYSTVWDAKTLRLSGIRNFSLKHLSKTNFSVNSNESGVSRLSWYPPDLKSISLVDGSTIYQMCFDVIGKSGKTTEVKFTDKPMIVEITNAQSQILALDTNPVVVTIE